MENKQHTVKKEIASLINPNDFTLVINQKEDGSIHVPNIPGRVILSKEFVQSVIDVYNEKIKEINALKSEAFGEKSSV